MGLKSCTLLLHKMRGPRHVSAIKRNITDQLFYCLLKKVNDKENEQAAYVQNQEEELKTKH